MIKLINKEDILTRAKKIIIRVTSDLDDINTIKRKKQFDLHPTDTNDKSYGYMVGYVQSCIDSGLSVDIEDKEDYYESHVIPTIIERNGIS